MSPPYPGCFRRCTALCSVHSAQPLVGTLWLSRPCPASQLGAWSLLQLHGSSCYFKFSLVPWLKTLVGIACRRDMWAGCCLDGRKALACPVPGPCLEVDTSMSAGQMEQPGLSSRRQSLSLLLDQEGP